MDVHHTLCLLTTTYRNEPAHIFTDCLNVFYLLNTQMKHPTLHNSHPDKKILEAIIKMLQSRTQITTLHKVKAHTNISGNEQADKLAKMGCELPYLNGRSGTPVPDNLRKQCQAGTASAVEISNSGTCR